MAPETAAPDEHLMGSKALPARLEMVTTQIEWRGLHDPRLLAAFRRVARHSFVPLDLQSQAYEDHPLPIGAGQTISQPYIVALMTDLLHLDGHETVLEIGTGSGYQAAILGALAQQVYSIERHPDLAERAQQVLGALGIRNVTVLCQDGSVGLPGFAPYQGILVTAAAPSVPKPLLEQLSPGGRLVIPVGSQNGQDLEVWERTSSGWERTSVAEVAFVPLRGSFGWSEEDWKNPLRSNS
jgi:protein-L-isoaspartate(D-aspartate) O-methyltransferase